MISNKKAMKMLRSGGGKKFNPGPVKKIVGNEAREYQQYIARIRRKVE